MKNLIPVKSKKGFSLVELLVVIAVIGVIAAIAIPAMSGIFGQSEVTKSKRNAQNIASTFAAGLAAGTTVTALVSEDASVAAVTTAPGLPGAGAFAGSYFLSRMSTGEATAAKAYLDWDGTANTLIYTGN